MSSDFCRINKSFPSLRPLHRPARVHGAQRMNTRMRKGRSMTGSLIGVVLAIGMTAFAVERPSLKESYEQHFLIGTAINPNIASGNARFRRTPEQVAKDVALVTEQFNQISSENDLKWQLIHPREGTNGYEFSSADAFVNFGLSNKMYIVGHTLVWHSQTPNWVFAGTNPPPTNATTNVAANTNAPATNQFGRGRSGG